MKPDDSCDNFFIQYKLAERIERSNGSEYDHWNKPYFRFSIPQGINDYHQFNLLEELSRKGYLVGYSANSVIYIEELFSLARSNTLLDETPFFNVEDIGNHKRVSFCRGSTYHLHSESAERIFITLKRLISRKVPDFKYRKTIISEVILALKEFIIKFEEKIGIKEISKFETEIRVKQDIVPSIIQDIDIIRKYLKIYFDLSWYIMI